MADIIKIGRDRKQCTVTIPRKMAMRTGLDKAKYAKIWINKKGRVVIEKHDPGREKE